MYISRKKTKSSFPEIGQKFGGKDHTTVMHAVSKMEKELLENIELQSSRDAILRKLDQLY